MGDGVDSALGSLPVDRKFERNYEMGKANPLQFRGAASHVFSNRTWC